MNRRPTQPQLSKEPPKELAEMVRSGRLIPPEGGWGHHEIIAPIATRPPGMTFSELLGRDDG